MYEQILFLTLLLAPAVAPLPPPPASPIQTPSQREAHPVASVETVLASLPIGPPIARVQAAVVQKMLLAPNQTRRWLRRVRAASLLPDLRSEFDVSNDRGWKLGQEAGSADELSEDQGAGRTLRVRATWHLDRLIFNVNELRVAQTGLDVQSARRRILVEVTGMYFERIECMLALEMNTVDPAKRAQTRLRLLELQALLHAFTGLAFPDYAGT
ncbi:MAG: hypothetical protein ACPG4T_19650 [Nannocystaceae bacterium]